MRKFIMVFTAAMIYAGIFSTGVVQAQHVTKIKGSDVVINGESFFALSNEIKTDLEKHARTDGFIGQSETFRSVAVSGDNISQILGLYKGCNPKPVYLISDGAGIDLMNGNCKDSTCSTIKNCKNTLLQYLDEMKKGGTKKLLWMVYPDPQGATYGGTLKTNQDIWAQVVPPIINACTNPKTLLVNLRTTWAGHYSSYTNDGIHPTSAGSQATADAFWKAIKDSNFFDTGTVTTSVYEKTEKTAPSMLRGHSVSNNTIVVSLFFAKPAALAMRVTTVSGRTIFTASKKQGIAGFQTVKFPLGAIVPGVYCLEVKTGEFSEQSSLLLR